MHAALVDAKPVPSRFSKLKDPQIVRRPVPMLNLPKPPMSAPVSPLMSPRVRSALGQTDNN